MIVAFEGIDGSGKGTQSQILSAKMSAKGIENSLYSFPNYKGTSFGLEVGKYLNGGFGSMDSLPAEFPSILYALDRFEMKKAILSDIKNGANIIFDRYVPSNIAHQSVKLPENQQKTFSDWVKRLEYNILEMPQPDAIIFLDVPPQIASKMVEKKEKRVYTDAVKDIHEENNEYLNKVYKKYKEMAIDEGWIIIPATDGENLIDKDIIAKNIIISLSQKGFPLKEERLF